MAEVTAPDGVTKVIYGFDAGMFPVSVKPVSEIKNEVVLYPNPVSTVLNIKGIEISAVQVYSISGSLMISEKAMYSNRVDVSSLPNGIYVIKMTDDAGEVAVKKFLKK